MKQSADNYATQNSVKDLSHSQHSKSHPAATCNPDNITILNWNVYKSRKQNAIMDLKRFSHQYDLLILQEAHLRTELKNTFADSALHWTMNPAFFYHKQATGVLIASRVKPIDSYGFRHKEPFIRLPKTTLINYYPIANTTQTLLVANIHSINFTLGTTVYNRQLHELITVVSQHDGPAIVAGDFNSWSHSRLFLLQAMQKKLGLHALDEVADTGNGYGSHYKTRIFGKAIDHVFYRGLVLIEQKIWPVDSSDHNPIQVRFRLNMD